MIPANKAVNSENIMATRGYPAIALVPATMPNPVRGTSGVCEPYILSPFLLLVDFLENNYDTTLIPALASYEISSARD